MICGVDEAGKGAVLGPMVIAAVGCRNQSDLGKLGIRDSKKLTPARREVLFEEITASFPVAVTSLSAPDIDTLRKRAGLNEILARAHAGVIGRLAPSCAIVDACDVNARRYGDSVVSFLPSPCRIIAQHHADDRHAVVGAASIVAKVTRDREMELLRDEFGPIGSGYPSDPATITYLTEYIAGHTEPPRCARTSWKTVATIMGTLTQSTLADYSGE
ncbi:MAG: ribonuclease HII [Methanoculleus sp. SDB]|nr:MAG: ribonuclease HII [Methanoculleus sp. SDB]